MLSGTLESAVKLCVSLVSQLYRMIACPAYRRWLNDAVEDAGGDGPCANRARRCTQKCQSSCRRVCRRKILDSWLKLSRIARERLVCVCADSTNCTRDRCNRNCNFCGTCNNLADHASTHRLSYTTRTRLVDGSFTDRSERWLYSRRSGIERA